MDDQPYLLAEIEDLSSIYFPLKSTSRIKYTCFTISNNYLIFGATSGGLYVFRREPCCFLQLLPNKEGIVTQVSISPNEKFIAFSTVRGIICILEKTSHGAKHLVITSEHQNDQITCLQWNTNNNELFVGDNTGKVSIVMMSIFPTKGMFQSPSFLLMQLDSKIIQMDFSSNMLLVSTITKCYICDTKKEIFRQVGHKLRDGEYGACIFNDNETHEDILPESERLTEVTDLSHLKLLCARPGSRVWECSIDGTVISTHHFKEALAVPPRKIYFLKDSSSQSSDLSNNVLTNGSCARNEQINAKYSEQSFNFQKLYVVSSRFFFTFKSDGIYVFDPQKAVVVLWNNQITNIVDAKSNNDVIYVWSGSGKMYAFNLVSLEKFLIRLYFQKKYLDLAKLCSEYKGFLMSEPNNYSKLYVLQDLDEKLKSDFTDELKPLINIYKETAQKRKVQNAQKINNSDIYLVGKNVQFLLEDKRLFSQKLLRPTYLNIKGRSHSVSPERFQNRVAPVRQRGSSSSLPDLTNEEDKTEEDDIENRTGNGAHKGDRVPPELRSKVDNVTRILNAIRQGEGPQSKNLVFNMFDNILDLEKWETLEAIRELPLKLYFNESDINVISHQVHTGLSTKNIFDWKFFTEDNLTDISSHYPIILTVHLASESLKLDYKLSKFLKLFSSALKETEIIEIIRQSNLSCHYRSLVEILDIYQESSLSSVSESTLNLSNVSSSPKFLNILYFLIKMGQVDKCAQYADKIDLNELIYLMLRFEETSKKAGKPPEMVELQCHTLFLTYLDKLPKESRNIEKCSQLIDEYILVCLENIHSSASSAKELLCECGFPCSRLQQSMAMFLEVGQALVEKTWLKNQRKCLEICGRISYLWKYLIRIRRREALESVWPLILQCGDLEELEKRSAEISEEILEEIVSGLAKLKMGNCLNCNGEIGRDGETISWADLGMVAIKLAGPEKTLEMFTKHSENMDSKELSQTFFQGLIFSAILDKRKPGLRKSLVDRLRGTKPNENAPVLPMSEEVRRRVFGAAENDNGESAAEGSVSRHHWGVKINFKDNCAVCSLPLDTKALLAEAGLIVFKCTHAFHSACLEKVNLRCPLCKKDNPKKKD